MFYNYIFRFKYVNGGTAFKTSKNSNFAHIFTYKKNENPIEDTIFIYKCVEVVKRKGRKYKRMKLEDWKKNFEEWSNTPDGWSKVTKLQVVPRVSGFKKDKKRR